jgi:hypothetical protein
MNKEIHPLAEIMPDLPQKDYQELLADIRTNGLLDPITLFEGKVLDGRNRLQRTVEQPDKATRQSLFSLTGRA